MNLRATLGLDTAGFTGPLAGARAALGGFRSGLGGLIGPLAGITGGLLSLAGAARLLKGAIDEAAQMEDMQVAFGTILGSASKAQARMEELAQFAAATPFQLPEIVAASRLLQAFTGDVLATGRGLRLVGDSAAAVGQPLEAVTMWMGRLFAALRGGQALGEPLQNLTQLGLISNQVRAQLLALQGQTLSDADALAALESAFGRNAGAMERLSQTYRGKLSTMADGWAELKRELGKPLIDGLKPLLDRTTAQFGSLKTQAREAGEALAGAIQMVSSGEFGTLLGISVAAAMDVAVGTLIDGIVAAGKMAWAYIRAPFQIIARDFGVALEGVWLKATIAAKRLGIMLAETAGSIAGKPMAVDQELQKSLAKDLVALHENRKQSKHAAEGLDAQIDANLTAMGDLPGLQANAIAGLKADLAGLRATFQQSLDPAQKIAGALAAFFDDIDAKAAELAAGPAAPAAGTGKLADIATDRFAKVGLFVGGAGGPSVDYARRTAENTARLVALVAKGGHTSGAGASGSWAL